MTEETNSDLQTHNKPKTAKLTRKTFRRTLGKGLPSVRKMSCAVLLDGNAKPKSMSRAKQWTDEVENLYRFQQAGYRDETEYRQIKQTEIDRWPETGFVKKLQRRDNTFYYYNRKRESSGPEQTAACAFKTASRPLAAAHPRVALLSEVLLVVKLEGLSPAGTADPTEAGKEYCGCRQQEPMVFF
ncbi:hypothetical protein SRHO_G00001810 [Serrasalmus rhombeus]